MSRHAQQAKKHRWASRKRHLKAKIVKRKRKVK